MRWPQTWLPATYHLHVLRTAFCLRSILSHNIQPTVTSMVQYYGVVSTVTCRVVHWLCAHTVRNMLRHFALSTDILARRDG